MKKIVVLDEIIREGQNILEGVYSPLCGFMHEHDLSSVLSRMRLADGRIWPMPVVLDVSREMANEMRDETTVALSNADGEDVLLMENVLTYPFDKQSYCQQLFGTNDETHPGVKKVQRMNDFLMGGTIRTLGALSKPENYFSPQETREIFKKNGWAHVVAFQTRNPPHRSHEHLQKTALKMVDGLLIHPVIGEKKAGDFLDERIIGAYHVLIEHHYPENSVVLGTFHTFMRYAGPKEAVFHALVRRNFGCTHMIIGRDHAGVGNFYGPYDAQKIFKQFDPQELGITILPFLNAMFCHGCQQMVFEGECNHAEADKVQLSGTKLRENLQQDADIPDGFMRKEVIEYLKLNRIDLFVQ